MAWNGEPKKHKLAALKAWKTRRRNAAAKKRGRKVASKKAR